MAAEVVHLIDSKVINNDTKLLSFIWLMATPESFRSVADRFNISKGTLHFIVRTLSTAFVKLASKSIVWPNNEQNKGHKNEI